MLKIVDGRIFINPSVLEKRMEVKRLIASKLVKEVGVKSVDEYLSLLEVPPDEKLGDYALPCFTFAKELQRNPVEAAKEIAAKVFTSDVVERAVATGPYVNLFLSRAVIGKSVVGDVLAQKASYGAGAPKGERVMIEYSQPNTHKAFHAGHLRGTSIGEALARILKHAGFEVVQANYSGDTGMHVAKWLWCYLKYHAKERAPKTLKGKWLAAIYVDAVSRLEENPSLQAEVDEINRKLDEGKDEALLKAWNESRQWSIDDLNAIYKDLDAHFDVWWFEREVEQRGKELARQLVEQSLAKVDDGATIIDLQEYKLGVWVLLRKDGTVLYSAKDLALAEKKFTEFKIDRSVYVVGKAQALHLQQLFKTLELLRFPQAKKCYHYPYEEVRLPDGKMSSRTGKNLLYQDVKSEVYAYAEQEVRKRHEDWAKPQISKVVKSVAACAMKFEMLARDRNKPIVFQVEKVCDFEGDTGPYVQYTLARANSILEKLERKPGMRGTDFNKLSSDEEYRVVKQLLRFPEVVGEAARSYAPESVATYALELSKAFNSFYHAKKVIGEEERVRQTRAALVFATAIVLERTLTLLGLPALKKM